MRSLLDRFGLSPRVAAVIAVSAVLLAAEVGLFVFAGIPRSVFKPPSASTNARAASLDPYRGLASWVDLFDKRAWGDPGAAVRDMARHGVRTIFVQTANSDSTSGLVHPSELGTFVTEAHARHMYVVAWYLPDLRPTPLDYDRVMQAIDFRTADGQRFDSFALDIEPNGLKSAGARNRGLTALSEKIRRQVGPTYALGAIIPPPRAIERKKGYWKSFPYAMLAETYDVFLPMNYYTFNSRHAAPAYTATTANMRILRARPGCASAPVHMIGGISEDSSLAQVKQFVRAVNETGCIGTSLYGWAGTSHAEWRVLSAVVASATP